MDNFHEPVWEKELEAAGKKFLKNWEDTTDVKDHELRHISQATLKHQESFKKFDHAIIKWQQYFLLKVDWLSSGELHVLILKRNQNFRVMKLWGSVICYSWK